MEGEQYGYVFDDIGNRKSTTQGGNKLGANLRSATYTPNSLNQISSRTVPSAVDIIGTSTAANTVTVNGTAAQYRKGSYFRHELAVSNGSGPAYTAVNVTADTTKLGNILTPPTTQNFSYDLDGNMTGDGVWSYIWDGENRLVEIQPLTNNAPASKRWLKFSYDWRGRRIQKTAATWDTVNARWSLTVSNRFLYSGWNLLGELNATNNSLIRGYIWGLDMSGSLQGAGGVGGLIAVNDAVNNASHFAAYDDMGNVVGFAKASDGSVTAMYEYDPFGQLIRASGTFAALNPIRFSSKYFDDEVGLSYYGYRYYNANLGRWINRDPIEEWGGPNVYGFVKNVPSTLTDLLGLVDTDVLPPPPSSINPSTDIQEASKAIKNYGTYTPKAKPLTSPGSALGRLANWLGALEASTVTLNGGDAEFEEALVRQMRQAEVSALKKQCGRKDRDLDDCLDNCDKAGLQGKALQDCYCQCWEKYPSTPRTKSSNSLIKDYTQNTRKNWPTDPDSGRPQTPNHIWPLADGGPDDWKNIEPLPRQEHVDLHKNNGDSSRWGKRKGRTCK
jgi:RHS repeat-associated protein